MNCAKCQRELTPAAARADGEPTTVGFNPCVCSREAWDRNREDGEDYEDYLRRVNAEHPLAAEAWWSRHAGLLAAKMKAGGVRSFHIERTPEGTFKFEVIPA